MPERDLTSIIDPCVLRATVARVRAESPFLSRLMDTHADIVPALTTRPVEIVVADAMALAEGEVAPRLRKMRARLFLACALADLSGVWSLDNVVAALSDFADLALDAAIDEAIIRHVPGAAPGGFVAIALGKHGSRELNYSSDIDPIFLYDPARLPRRPREEPAEAAVRIARRVIDLLQAQSGDGFVFRVDLRLRPAAEATPIALPVDAAIGHYESSALTWERAAFIRARAAAGDIALGERFLATIAPFVWRRSLDFGAVGELQALTHAIRSAHGQRAPGPGYDVKRGRGGIREIEFYAQIHQLIHGGRDPRLRDGATRPALAALAAAGWMGPEVARELHDAYELLRTVEHRLQLIDDRQTHVIPEAAGARDAVARLHGVADGAALLALIAPHVARVGALYDTLNGGGRAEAAALTFDGFADARAAAARLERWRGGAVRAIRSPAAVAAFDALLPELIDDLTRAPDPDAALGRLDRVLGQLSSGINLFRLLAAQPAARALFIDILSYAPPLADALAQQPALIDRLLDRTALDPAPGMAALRYEMTAVAGAPLEAVLDRVRRVVGEYRFALGTQLVEGATDPMAVASGYGRLAEAALAVATAAVVTAFEDGHGRVAGAEFVILALGRLGGGLLTHASDLDLVYLFTGDFAAESGGARPLGASLYFNRLGQRVTAALSVATSAGALYEVDTRLRPSGAQGPLVVSLETFDRYQREAAWTWERMALTRARVVFGSDAARRAVDDVVHGALRRPITPEQLARDVVAMRGEVALHKPPAGPLDVKLAAGGLVDLEFVVHFHQLRHGVGLVPDLRGAIAALVAAGLVAPAMRGAHDLLTRLIVMLRLVAPDLTEPPSASRALIAGACGVADWAALLAAVAAARQDVRHEWDRVVEAVR